MSVPPRFWPIVWLLLVTAWRRRAGWLRHQRKLAVARRRGGFAGFAIWLVLPMLVGLHGGAAFGLYQVVAAAQRAEIERDGAIVVDHGFVQAVAQARRDAATDADPWSRAVRSLRGPIASQAHRLAASGGDERALRARLTDIVASGQLAALRDADQDVGGLAGLGPSHALPAMLGSFVLLLWSVLLVCIGDGIDRDVLRRRHPIWEWLFSHPVPPAAVFFAELVAPLANPLCAAGIGFPAVAYGFVYGPRLGAVAAVAVGLPIVVSAACFGKALEIAMTLRTPPRVRGLLIGAMRALGAAAGLPLLLLATKLQTIPPSIAALFAPLEAIPWPWLGLFLGIGADGHADFLRGIATCWMIGLAIGLLSLGIAVWAVGRGLVGEGGAVPKRSAGGVGAFGRDAVQRKELLWLRRDREAITQAIIVPLCLAGVQLVNAGHAVAAAGRAWNYLCGAAVLFGTYFLTYLGPRSLASEGAALWIPLSWPFGIESLLRAKARLWAGLSTALSAPIFLYAAWAFPESAWKVALLALAWFAFAHSLASKSVTLASPPDSSGVCEPVPWRRRGAALLGTFTFALGVLGQRWTLAITGFVYAYLTSAAMWQNFRARLPYLLDPWSEPPPDAPSLMHAMVAIAAMVDLGSILGGIWLGIEGQRSYAMALAGSYGISALIVWQFVRHFLKGRGVADGRIWQWASAVPGRRSFKVLLPKVALGAGVGLLLGGFGLGYEWALRQLPATTKLLDASEAEAAAIPHLHLGLLAAGVLMAPFAEEYLFRGLLYRALDREWGGALAVLGSAAFFAIYHPPMAWLPVGVLGAASAALFKRTGRLEASVALHMVYNAIVVS